MINFVVSVICSDPLSGQEITLAKFESQAFDIEHAEARIGIALEAAQSAINAPNLTSLRIWKPEVSISLVADDELVRPALHLGAQTLQQLSEAGASLDFDPYV